MIWFEDARCKLLLCLDFDPAGRIAFQGFLFVNQPLTKMFDDGLDSGAMTHTISLFFEPREISFDDCHRQLVGLKVRASVPRSEVVRKLQKALNGPVKVFGFGPKQARAIGIITGAAASEIYRVAEENIDTFITGEAPHWAAVAAEELGVNLLLGGHYATEVFGVKALAAHLSKRFRVPWEFIDCPTGL